MTHFETSTDNLNRVKEVLGNTYDDRTILKALTVNQNDFERAINYLLEGDFSSPARHQPATQQQLRQSITDAFNPNQSKDPNPWFSNPEWTAPPSDRVPPIDNDTQPLLDSQNEAREPLVLPNSPPKGSYQPLTVTGQTTPTEDFRTSDQAFQLSNTRLNHIVSNNPTSSQSLPNLPSNSTDIQLIDDNTEKRYEAELSAAIEASLAADSALNNPSQNKNPANSASLKDITAEDEQMSKALEESLAMSSSRTLEADGKFFHPPPSRRQRSAGTPTALRVHNPHLVFLPCVLSAMYAAKPFRDRILAFESNPQTISQELVEHGFEGLWNGKSSWRSGDNWSDKPQASEIILAIQRLFALMTHTKRAYIDAHEISLLLGYEEGEMISWSLNEPNKGCHRTYETIAEAWKELSWTIFKMKHPQCEQDEKLLREYELEHRLFHWKGHKLPLPLSEEEPLANTLTPSTDNSTTSLTLNPLDSTLNDIYSCIDAQVWLPESNMAHFLDGTSQVIAFEIDRRSSWNSSFTSNHLTDVKAPFKLELEFWVDRYLYQKRHKTAELREEISRIEGEADVSLARRNQLSQAGDKDLLSTLKAAIDYLSVATQFPASAIAEREKKKKEMLPKFQESLKRLETELASLDQKAKTALEAAKAVFDVDEMRQVGPHELCSVVVSDGFSGREHMWTYVKADDGRWFKSLDHIVTEVSIETVLSDPAGLHMNSGHIFAIYMQKTPTQEPPIDSLNIKLAPHLEQAIIKDNELFDAELLEAATLPKSGFAEPTEDVEMTSDSPRSDVADVGGPLDLDLPSRTGTPEIGSPIRLYGGAKSEMSDDSRDLSEDEEEGQDIDSAEEDDDDLAELGFLKKIKKPLNIQTMTGKVGGDPIWLDPSSPLDPTSFTCALCNTTMSFLMQLNAPDDSNPNSYFRTIYVFICRKLACFNNPQANGSIKVFRTQLTRSQFEHTTSRLKHGQNKFQFDQQFREWEIVCDEEPAENHDLGSSVNLNHGFDEMNSKLDLAKHSKDQDSKIKDTKIKVDDAFLKFQARISRAPGQIIRYLRIKTPTIEPLWANEKTEAVEEILKKRSLCPTCGGQRSAEFQIIPTLLSYIKPEDGVRNKSEEADEIDFGTIIILTCLNSCDADSSRSQDTRDPSSDQFQRKGKNGNWVEESCLIQLFSNDGIFDHPLHRPT